MHQEINEAYRPLFVEKRHYSILMGGRGAGRSTVASQYILAKLIAPEYFRCAIMRFILSDIRNSCFQEILDRAEEHGIRDKLQVNVNEMSITYGKNFIHAHAFRKSTGEQKAKLKSLANYNQIWIEESDEVPEADFMQLDDSLRTVKGDINVLMTLNPPAKSHWIIHRWFSLSPSEEAGFYVPACVNNDVLFIHTDWHDNAVNIAENTRKRYEEYRWTKPAHYWSMIKGYVPETVIGKLFNNWKEVDEVPFGARLERRGLDFGWSPDPAAIVDVYYYNGGYILDEILYQIEMRNTDIGNTIKQQLKQCLVIADSAEPKSIAELQLMGLNIMPCEKGADSISYGIGVMQGVPISYTKRSVHLKDEYDNYALKKNRDGEFLAGEPQEGNDHCIDAARYGVTSIFPAKQRQDFMQRLPRRQDNARPQNPAR